MGFLRPQYKLKFDGNFEGFEVLTKGASLDEVVRLSAILSQGEELLAPDNGAARKELVELLGSKLISWNLTEEVEIPGTDRTEERPVPATAEQLALEDWNIVLILGRAWMQQGVGVSAPLPEPSPDGAPSEVQSMTMEPL